MSSSEEAFHEDPAVADAIAALLAQVPADAGNRDLIGKMLGQVMQLPSEPLTRGELKLLEKSMRDFRAAFTGFAGHRERKKISIFGSARSPEGSPIYAHCQEFSRAAVERGYMVITGAGPGIMQAGNQGAGREHSFGVSIDLPFEASANPYIDSDPKHVHFKYFFSRKLSFVKESDAIVLYPGGFGTMDEGFETLTLIQTGKCNPIPVIMIDVPGGSYWIDWEMFVRDVLQRNGLISNDDFNLFRYTTDIQKAIDEIELFYRNYHSLRYVGSECILRLKREPTDELLALLNSRYRELLASGTFERMSSPHDAEKSEPEEVRALPRIRFHFVQRRFGTLRRMIDTINLTDF